MSICIKPLKHITYSNLTIQLPHISSRGNKYVLTIYDYDANVVLAGVLKTQQAKETAAVWEAKHLQLIKNGHDIKYYILDNECRKRLQEALKKNSLTYQLMPPNQHPRNEAERAVRTFKNFLRAGLVTCDTKFPIHEWGC